MGESYNEYIYTVRWFRLALYFTFPFRNVSTTISVWNRNWR